MDLNKVLSDLRAQAKPELEKRAIELRALFLDEIDEYVDKTNISKFDDLLKRAAEYEIQAVTENDVEIARQFAEAAEDTLRQIKLLLIAERIVASRELAGIIQAAAISMWEGFKTVAMSAISVAAKGVITGLLGPGGTALANTVGEFLDSAIGPQNNNDK